MTKTRSAPPSTPSSFSQTRLGGFYFAFQAGAISLWWILLWRFPELRRLFLPATSPEHDLLAFWLPDLALGALGSLLAAVLFFTRAPWLIPLVWTVTGAMLYAALYCFTWSFLTDSAWWNVALMTPAAFFSALFALDLSPSVVPVFRRAKNAPPTTNLVKTLLQITFFWTFFLLVLPLAFRGLEAKLGLLPFSFPGQVPLAVLLFALASALGLASGVTMARRGAGTPLPFDGTNQLVVSGPYAHLRNPMVVAGLTQGLAVGIGLGSWSMPGAVVCGGLIWEILVRPAEEAELMAKFGEPFARYRDQVPCWWPRSNEP